MVSVSLLGFFSSAPSNGLLGSKALTSKTMSFEETTAAPPMDVTEETPN